MPGRGRCHGVILVFGVVSLMLGTITDILSDWEGNVAVCAKGSSQPRQNRYRGGNMCLLDGLRQLILSVRLLVMTLLGVNWFIGFVRHICLTCLMIHRGWHFIKCLATERLEAK